MVETGGQGPSCSCTVEFQSLIEIERETDTKSNRKLKQQNISHSGVSLNHLCDTSTSEPPILWHKPPTEERKDGDGTKNDAGIVERLACNRPEKWGEKDRRHVQVP